MNYKAIFNKVVLGMTVVALCQSCNENKQPAEQLADAGKGLPQAVEESKGQIAYVEIDSIMTQYEFCKEYSKILSDKSESYKTQIESKGRALQNAAMNFQQKIQEGTITQEEAQKQQASLQRQDENFRKLQEDLAVKFEEEQAKFNVALHDSVHNFLRDFNKDKRYSLILSKSGDNLLYADEDMNITDEVVAGLNKRYKK